MGASFDVQTSQLRNASSEMARYAQKLGSLNREINAVKSNLHIHGSGRTGIIAGLALVTGQIERQQSSMRQFGSAAQNIAGAYERAERAVMAAGAAGSGVSGIRSITARIVIKPVPIHITQPKPNPNVILRRIFPNTPAIGLILIAPAVTPPTYRWKSMITMKTDGFRTTGPIRANQIITPEKRYISCQSKSVKQTWTISLKG